MGWGDYWLCKGVVIYFLADAFFYLICKVKNQPTMLRTLQNLLKQLWLCVGLILCKTCKGFGYFQQLEHKCALRSHGRTLFDYFYQVEVNS
jgi:hypothetical protein